MWGGKKGEDHLCSSHISSWIMLSGKGKLALFFFFFREKKATLTPLAKLSPWFLGGNPSRAVVFKVWSLNQNLLHRQTFWIRDSGVGPWNMSFNKPSGDSDSGFHPSEISPRFFYSSLSLPHIPLILWAAVIILEDFESDSFFSYGKKKRFPLWLPLEYCWCEHR